MARVHCRAVIMGDQSGADSAYTFEIDRPFDILPADELVEHLMDHLHAEGVLTQRYDYELNSAIRNREQQVVMAIGTLALSNQRLPFAVLVSPLDRT